MNLKNSNQGITYAHFNMKGLFLLKELLQENNNTCKIDLKDAYFSVPLSPDLQKVQMERSNLSVYLPVLWSGTSTKDIYKTTKNSHLPVEETECTSNNISGRYFDHYLISRRNDTLIFLLQGLGCLIDLKKSVLQPCQVMQFLGMEIDSVYMTLGLPQEEKDRIVQQCQSPLRRSSAPIMELTQLIGKLKAAANAVIPLVLQCWVMQRQQILGLLTEKNYDSLS